MNRFLLRLLKRLAKWYKMKIMYEDMNSGACLCEHCTNDCPKRESTIIRDLSGYGDFGS